jgi:predicted nucleic-acid-binding Zn-ribbon protein
VYEVFNPSEENMAARPEASGEVCVKCGGRTFSANPLTGVGTLSVGRQYLAYRGVPTRCVVCGTCGYVEIYALDPARAAVHLAPPESETVP